MFFRSSLTSAGDPDALELAASEMATAAAALVSIERSMLQVTADGADPAVLAAKQVGSDVCAGAVESSRARCNQLQRAVPGSVSPTVQLCSAGGMMFTHACASMRLQAERAEAASMLERRLAAIEALLTARRQVAAVAVVKVAEPALPDFMKPPPTVRAQGARAAQLGVSCCVKVGGWQRACPARCHEAASPRPQR